MKFNKIMGLAALSLGILTLAGCSKLTKENYDQLKIGMELTELEDVIGSADKCNETMGAQSCTWGDDSKNIQVKLVAGKAVFFSHKGLE
ncbi:MAG: hypothetical protein MI867_00345 [Pseudomonadales bacterium]|nr:hypothetical protein [Pseudomonadales bacterium]